MRILFTIYFIGALIRVMGYIYSATNKITGKKYIGQTINEVDQRWRQHQAPSSKCAKLRDAIVKYGIENFKCEIICICFDDALDDMEVMYIDKYNTVNNGYNILGGGGQGGSNRRWSEERKKEFSIKCMGRVITEETRRKISLKLTGRSLSPEHQEKARKAFLGHKHTAASRILMSQNNNPTGRMKVNQFTIDGVFVKQYDSVSDAAKVVNVGKAAMSRACAVETSVCQGFRWKWGDPDAIAARPKQVVGRRESFKGKKHTDETKSILRQKSNWNGRKVDKFTLEGVFVRRFDCLKDAANSVDVDVRSVRNVCDGKGAYSRRHLWRWASGTETPDDISPCTVDTSRVRG